MSALVVGAIIGQLPLGWLSDRIDRRLVIAGACVAAATAALLLARLDDASTPQLFAAGFAFGLVALPVYSLCVAHANDLGASADFVSISSGLLLLFGVGAMFGPFVASFAMSKVGPGRLFKRALSDVDLEER